MNHYRYATACCGLLLLFSGCASTMRVSVEMIKPQGGFGQDDTMPGASSLVQAVQDTVSALEQYTQAVDNLKLQDGDFAAQTFGEVLSQRESYRASILQGNSLLAKASQMADLPGRSALAAEMRKYTSDVAGQAQQRSKLTVAKCSQLSDRGRAKCEPLIRTLDALGDALETETLSAKEAGMQTLGFGGLQYCGTDVVAPGDPRYRDVVRGTPIGVISKAETRALGNSTIVFFQERPAEIKNFSTDLNAEQLMKNVAYVSDKATTAFTKYLSAGAGIPAP